jgi:hypothetical protein
VSANGDAEAERFNGYAADDEDGALRRAGKEHQRSGGEKKSGWHDQQSGIFHPISLTRPCAGGSSETMA